jgi:acetoin utilization deacetylase AcuC-like enzyme
MAIDAGARRVLILDLDAHCGGGTYSLVAEWPEVSGVDVSVSAFDAYQAGERFTLDLVGEADAYLPTIRRRLDEVRAQGWDLVLYNAGMDPHQDAGGRAGITTDVLAVREELVFRWADDVGVPVAFCLAGGYTGHRMPQDRLVDLHRLTVEAATRATRPATDTEVAHGG